MSGSADPKFLVVGASGLLGGALLARLGPAATGTYAHNPRPALIELDVTDSGRVGDVIEASRPDVIIDCAAWTHVDGCEQDPERSHAVTVGGAENVARVAEKIGARMIFVSTDYVFDGRDGPYRLGAPTAPINVYGRHKLEAEGVVAAVCPNHAIVRTCNLYGYQEGGKNYSMAVFERGRAGEKILAAADQWGNPTLADDAANAIAVAAMSDVRGALHLAGPTYVDRLAWAQRAAAAFGVGARAIERVTTAALGQAAKRPLKAGLDSAASCKRLGVRLRALDDGLAAMADAMRRAGVKLGKPA